MSSRVKSESLRSTGKGGNYIGEVEKKATHGTSQPGILIRYKVSAKGDSEFLLIFDDGNFQRRLDIPSVRLAGAHSQVSALQEYSALRLRSSTNIPAKERYIFQGSLPGYMAGDVGIVPNSMGHFVENWSETEGS
jgi:hypothetical protein